MRWINFLGMFNLMALLFVGVPVLLIGAMFGPVIHSALLGTAFDVSQDYNGKAGTTVEVTEADFGPVGESLKIPIMGVGGAIIFICLLGFLAVLTELKPIFILYLLVLLYYIFFQLLLIGKFAEDTNAFFGCIKAHILSTITDHYEGLNSSEVFTVTWNVHMIQNQCCGVDNYLDFENATKWTRELNRTKLVIPMACCRIPSTDLECSRMPRDYNSHFLTGCFPKFKDKIERWKDTILAIGGTIVGVQISMVFLALYVMSELGIDVWFRELILKPLGLSELPPEPTPEPITPA